MQKRLPIPSELEKYYTTFWSSIALSDLWKIVEVFSTLTAVVPYLRIMEACGWNKALYQQALDRGVFKMTGRGRFSFYQPGAVYRLAPEMENLWWYASMERNVFDSAIQESSVSKTLGDGGNGSVEVFMSPEARAALENGIESAKKEPPVYLGSFSSYADEDLSD